MTYATLWMSGSLVAEKMLIEISGMGSGAEIGQGSLTVGFLSRNAICLPWCIGLAWWEAAALGCIPAELADGKVLVSGAMIKPYVH